MPSHSIQLSSVTALDAAGILRVPDAGDNKYRRGVVALITGSADYPGAGVLGVGGALRSGAAVARFLGSATASSAVLATYPETVFQPGRTDAVVIGSGWGDDLLSAAEEALTQPYPAVLDAGILDHARLWRGRENPPLVITPHYGEAARLWRTLEPDLDPTVEQVQAKPVEAANRLAYLTKAVVVLKGSTTHVAQPTGVTWEFVGLTGWAGCAGSGDVLAGVIGSLLAQKQADAHYRGTPLEVAKTAAVAVWLHGQAAGRAAGVGGFADDAPSASALVGGGRPILAQDIAREIPAVWQRVV